MDMQGPPAPQAGPHAAPIPADAAGIKEGVAAFGAKTFTKMIRMEDGRTLRVTITYPKSSKVTPEKAQADLEKTGARMVKLASGVGLGKGGLERISIKKGQVYGVWTNDKGKRVSGNLRKKLEKDFAAINDPKSPQAKAIEAQVLTIDKTMKKFKEIYASISTKD